mgnify:CR=1 FL=1
MAHARPGYGGGRFVSTILAAACGILAAWSGYVLFQEASPYFVSGVTVDAKIEALAAGRLAAGPSLFSQRMALDDCLLAIGAPKVRAGPRSVRDQILAQCAGLAAEIVTSVPSHSYGWLVAAWVAGEQRDYPKLSERIELSQSTSRSEGWLARARVALAERFADELAASATAAVDDDIRLLISHSRDIAAMVDRYVARESFRRRIDRLLQRVPAEAQARFIQSVRARLSEAGR